MVRRKYLLYGSHFLARWGERMWEFAVALLLLDVVGNSIFLVGAFGFAESVATILGGAQVGRWIDTTNRLTAVRNFLLAQNVLIAASAACILSLFHFKPSHEIHIVLIVATIVTGALSKLARVGSGVALEKDWVVVIAHGDKTELAVMNAAMRRIDLCCKILAPSVVGFVIAYSAQLGALCIAGWNVAVFALEYAMVRSAYNSDVALHTRERKRSASETDAEGCCQSTFRIFTMLCKGWSSYRKQQVVWAAWGLALLYFTVLSFGILMTAYLKWAGMPESILGVTRGIGAAFGVTATFVYPPLRKRIGLRASGMVAIVAEFVCLLPCAVAAFFAIGRYSVGKDWFGDVLGSYPTTAHAQGAGTVPWLALGLMMGGVITARFGLWLYDLVVSQMLQEMVPESERGLVSGFQQSAQSFFGMSVYLSGMVDHRPGNFGYLVFISLFMVLLAVLSYSVFACQRRRVGGGGKPLLGDQKARGQGQDVGGTSSGHEYQTFGNGGGQDGRGELRDAV